MEGLNESPEFLQKQLLHNLPHIQHLQPPLISQNKLFTPHLLSIARQFLLTALPLFPKPPANYAYLSL